jgi:hypothetical protein
MWVNSLCQTKIHFFIRTVLQTHVCSKINHYLWRHRRKECRNVRVLASFQLNCRSRDVVLMFLTIAVLLGRVCGRDAQYFKSSSSCDILAVWTQSSLCHEARLGRKLFTWSSTQAVQTWWFPLGAQSLPCPPLARPGSSTPFPGWWVCLGQRSCPLSSLDSPSQEVSPSGWSCTLSSLSSGGEAHHTGASSQKSKLWGSLWLPPVMGIIFSIFYEIEIISRVDFESIM